MYSVVITAAGSGSRSGLGYNKMLFELDGLTVIERIVKLFINNQLFDQVIVTASEKDLQSYKQILANYEIELVVGGSERMHSVAKGVEAATNQTVYVHDGARVFLDDRLIDRLASYPNNPDGLALATQVIDTTLLVKGDKISKILDRSTLYNMQTPQVVNKPVYQNCYKQAIAEDMLFTDEMSMLTNYGYDCRVVLSESYNRKLTKPEDFEV